MSDIEGGCACGAIRFKITEPPLGAGACYCRTCQYQTGGGPTYVALVPKTGFAITKGEPQVWTTKGDSGAEIGRAFCGECGTPVYSITNAMTPFYPVKVGALDDPSAVQPQIHIFCESAQPWHVFHEGLPQFPKTPPGPPPG